MLHMKAKGVVSMLAEARFYSTVNGEILNWDCFMSGVIVAWSFVELVLPEGHNW